MTNPPFDKIVKFVTVTPKIHLFKTCEKLIETSYGGNDYMKKCGRI